jgi:hypothetical protein
LPLDNVYLNGNYSIILLPILAYSLICFWLFGTSSLSVDHMSFLLLYIYWFSTQYNLFVEYLTWHPSCTVSNPNQSIFTTLMLATLADYLQPNPARNLFNHLTMPLDIHSLSPKNNNYQQLRISKRTNATSRRAT